MIIKVILMEPENPGNIGAVARVMKNFGFSELVLINPRANHLSVEAKNRAKHAQDVLTNAIVAQSDYLESLDLKIATTGQLGTAYNINRSCLLPEQLREKVNGNAGIIFGREGSGLTNKEISACDFAVTISAADYNSLNISHAVAIILYELSKGHHTKGRTERASAEEKNALFKLIDASIERMGFSTETKKNTQKNTWRRVIGKSVLTKREFFVLAGFFRKIK